MDVLVGRIEIDQLAFDLRTRARSSAGCAGHRDTAARGTRHASRLLPQHDKGLHSRPAVKWNGKRKSGGVWTELRGAGPNSAYKLQLYLYVV